MKGYERLLHEQLKPFVETFFSGFVAGYRERYSFNNVPMQLIRNWSKARDENFQRGTVLMDLSKAFDCIPYDLLIAKLYAHDLRIDDIISLWKF